MAGCLRAREEHLPPAGDCRLPRERVPGLGAAGDPCPGGAGLHLDGGLCIRYSDDAGYGALDVDGYEGDEWAVEGACDP